MVDFLSRIGLISIGLLILFLIKKVYDYFYFKNEESKVYVIDKEDDE